VEIGEALLDAEAEGGLQWRVRSLGLAAKDVNEADACQSARKQERKTTLSSEILRRD